MIRLSTASLHKPSPRVKSCFVATLTARRLRRNHFQRYAHLTKPAAASSRTSRQESPPMTNDALLNKASAIELCCRAFAKNIWVTKPRLKPTPHDRSQHRPSHAHVAKAKPGTPAMPSLCRKSRRDPTRHRQLDACHGRFPQRSRPLVPEPEHAGVALNTQAPH